MMFSAQAISTRPAYDHNLSYFVPIVTIQIKLVSCSNSCGGECSRNRTAKQNRNFPSWNHLKHSPSRHDSHHGHPLKSCETDTLEQLAGKFHPNQLAWDKRLKFTRIVFNAFQYIFFSFFNASQKVEANCN